MNLTINIYVTDSMCLATNEAQYGNNASGNWHIKHNVIEREAPLDNDWIIANKRREQVAVLRKSRL